MSTLSIYIPTWNRQHLLNRLLKSIEPQLCDEVDVFVSVNHKPDYDLPDWVSRRQTRINVGGDANIIPGPTLVNGEYVWVMGDDEQLLDGAIKACLYAIKSKPGLIIHPDGVFNLGVPVGAEFENYGEFCKAAMKGNSGRLITAHTLISSNTFMRTAYDPAIAIQKIDTRYGFHYGMLNNLFDKPVAIAPRPTVRYGSEASIFLQPKEVIDEHMAAYPQVIYDIFDWVQERTGVEIPYSCYGRGFD
jgi:glycosyltransferase involved in cell wall biosynthesis